MATGRGLQLQGCTRGTGPRAKQSMHQLAAAGAGKVVKSVPDTRPAREREAAIFSS